MSKILVDVKRAMLALSHDMDNFSGLDSWGSYTNMPVPDELVDTVLLNACLTIRTLSVKVARLQAQYKITVLRWLLAEAEYAAGG